MAPRLPLLAAAAWLGTTPAMAQALSCQAVFGDRTVTVEFARRSGEVSQLLYGQVVGVSNDAVTLLEGCLQRELESRPDPEVCRQAFVRLQKAASSLADLEAALQRLLSVHRLDRTQALYDDALARILKDMPVPPARVRRDGHRFGPAAADPSAGPSAPRGLSEVLEFQKADVVLVQRSFDNAVEAFRSSLPAAEHGGLAVSVYSGRSPLLSRILEATEQLETYRRFHFDACRATVAAVEQVYPSGLQWLEEPTTERPGPP
jgi:hypothetical protein